MRIRSLYLAAIEEEDWKAVGAPVYVRGFLRTYARFLGIDPEEAVGEFNRTQPASTPVGSPSHERKSAAESSRRGGILIAVAAAVAVLLVAFVVYNELTLRAQQSGGEQVAAQPSDAPSAASAASASEEPSPTPVASPTPAYGGSNSLALVLSAPSWLRVTVDGSVSMEGTFPAGTAKTFHGKNARVRIGNAGGVEIYVDGRDRGKLGKSGDVVEQAFTL